MSDWPNTETVYCILWAAACASLIRDVRVLFPMVIVGSVLFTVFQLKVAAAILAVAGMAFAAVLWLGSLMDDRNGH